MGLAYHEYSCLMEKLLMMCEPITVWAGVDGVSNIPAPWSANTLPAYLFATTLLPTSKHGLRELAARRPWYFGYATKLKFLLAEREHSYRERISMAERGGWNVSALFLRLRADGLVVSGRNTLSVLCGLLVCQL